MTDTNSWWARKLGRAPAAPTGPQTYQMPGNGPVGPPTGSITPGGTQMQMVQAQQQSGPPPLMVEDPDVPGGKRLNWRAWTGGKAARMETDHCPNCGSANYFSRRSESKVTQNGMASPAPQCFECSYNGMFTIFGGDS